MSSLTQCNYCGLRDLRARAKKEGKRVVRRASNGGLGGTDFFLVPKGIEVPKVIVGASWQLPNGGEFHQQYFAVWMKEISNECCC